MFPLSTSCHCPFKIPLFQIWRMGLGLVNAVVLCFLVVAVYKIAATLETMDTRLRNIERVLMPRI